MFELVALVVALIGSSFAAWEDLKTTEIPDIIPHAMTVSGLIIYAVQSFLLWDYWPLVYSVTTGLSFLGFGFLMYRLGQWGGGDAKVLSAIGFLLPTYSMFPKGVRLMFPFPISYFVNLFFVGAVYMLVYAVVIAARNRKIVAEFARSVRASSKIIYIGSLALFGCFLTFGWYLSVMFDFRLTSLFLIINSLLPVVMTIFLFVVWKFTKAVEDMGFKKRVNVRRLRVGDVLLKSKVWEGITEKELRAIRRSKKKYVWIKEGVRFAPAFPLALLFTAYFGDAIFIFLRFLI